MHRYEGAPDAHMSEKERAIGEALSSLDGFASERSKALLAEMDLNQEKRLITGPNRAFTFFGAWHTNDAKSSTAQSLRTDLVKLFDQDHDRQDPRKIVFMIEGKHGGFSREKAIKEMETVRSWQEAVEQSGESGVAMWFVKKYAEMGKKVEITSPEIDHDAVIETLKAEGFKSEEIAAYLALRQFTSDIGGDHLRGDRNAALHHFSRTFFDFQRETGVGWIKEMKSIEELQALDQPQMEAYKEKVTQQFLDGLNTWLKNNGLTTRDIVHYDALLDRNRADASMEDINDLSDPMDQPDAGRSPRNSVINKISARWNTERDKYLVVQIGKAMAKGKKPYVIFGASHLAHCDSALQKLAVIDQL